MREGRGVLVSPDSSREVSQLLEVCSHSVAVAKEGRVAARIGVVIVQGRVLRRAKWTRVEFLRPPSHVTRERQGTEANVPELTVEMQSYANDSYEDPHATALRRSCKNRTPPMSLLRIRT